MEAHHSENGTSPFVAQETPASTGSPEDTSLIECPKCNEEVPVEEWDQHGEFHEVEEGGDEALEPITNGSAQALHPHGYKSPYSSHPSDVPPVLAKYGHRQVERSPLEARNHQSGTIDRWRHILKLDSISGRRETSESSAKGQRKRLGVRQINVADSAATS